MSNEIAEKLAQAVNMSDTESATVQKGLEKTAVADDTKQSAETTEKGRQAKSQAVPYDRFKEQNDALKDALGRIESVTEENKELSVKLAQLESDHDVLERLRGLAGDERYKSLVETLDKALRGIHEDVQSGDKTKAEAKADTKALLDDHKAQLEDLVAQQKADLLWESAKSLSARMLDNLGEDYDETDKEAIARLWNPATDWDAIEMNPDSIQDELLRSLKNVVEVYGEPRGALKAKVKQFEEKVQQVEKTPTKVPTPEESLKGILETDWGKVKTNADGKVIGAEHSDEDFKNALARVMRMGRQ